MIEYRDVPGFPGYRVGSDGSVWSCRLKGRKKDGQDRTGNEWRPMKVKRHKRGEYLVVTLCVDNVYKTFLLHRLVLLAFVGPPPEGKPLGLHDNDDKTNNTPGNLYWGTHVENMRDAMRNGKVTKGEINGCAKLSAEQVMEIKRLRAQEGLGSRRLAKMFGVGPTSVQLILSGTNWKHIEDEHESEFVDQGDCIRGDRNPAAKVTEDQVREIRKLYTEGRHSQSALAKMFGLTQTNVSQMVLRKTWAHIT